MSVFLDVVKRGYDAKQKTGNKSVRVYTPVGDASRGQFALNVTAEIIPFFENFFNVLYPLPKMYLIGLSDFASGLSLPWCPSPSRLTLHPSWRYHVVMCD